MVNTFLPFASFEASVRCLDNKRLGKQRVEAYQARRARCAFGRCFLHLMRQRLVPPQIWRIVSGAAPAGGGWRNHPATRAWEGHADALARYANACVDEWTRRGFVNNMPRLEQRAPEAPQLPWCAQRARAHR